MMRELCEKIAEEQEGIVSPAPAWLTGGEARRVCVESSVKQGRVWNQERVPGRSVIKLEITKSEQQTQIS